MTKTVYDTVPDQPAHTIKEGDSWGCLALIVPLVVFIVVSIIDSYVFAAILAIVAFSLIAYVLVKVDSTWYQGERVVPATTKEVPRQVTENKQIATHRCCVQCKHPTKALR